MLIFIINYNIFINIKALIKRIKIKGHKSNKNIIVKQIKDYDHGFDKNKKHEN